MKDEAILHAATNVNGSECRVGLGITKQEYEALSEDEKDQFINEMLGNVVDVWVD